MRVEPESPLSISRTVEVVTLELPINNKDAFDTVDLWLRREGLMPEYLLYRGADGRRLEHVKMYGTDRDDLDLACVNYDYLKKNPGNGTFHPFRLARQTPVPMVLMYDDRLLTHEIGFAYTISSLVHPTWALQQVLLFNR